MAVNQPEHSDIYIYPKAALEFAAQQPPESTIQHGTHPFSGGIEPVYKFAAVGEETFSALILPPSLYSVLSNPNASLNTRMALGGSVTSAIGAAYFAYKYFEKRENILRDSALSREALQSHFEQPIDADRSDIRWYGFDRRYHEPGYDPAQATEEFARLVDTANIDTAAEITVSAAVLDGVPNPDAFTDQKVTKPFHDGRIIDKQSDSELLRLPIDKAIELKDILLESHKGQTIAKSLKILAEIDPSHPAPGIFKRDGFSSLTALENALRLRIETRASGATAVEIRFATKGPSVLLKGHSQATVQGRKIMYFTETPPEKRLGRGTRTFEGSETIAGDKSYGELFQDIDRSMANGSKPVESLEQIAWRALQDYKENHSSTPTNALPLYESVGARLQVEKPRAFPILRRYAKGYDADTSTLEFRSPQRKTAVKAAAAVVLAGAVITGALQLLPEHDGSGSSSSASRVNDRGNIVGTNGSSRFGDVGDSGSNSLVWQLDIPDGVDASGYWPQQNVKTLIAYGTKPENSIAPYDNIAVHANPARIDLAELVEISQQKPGKNAIRLTTEKFIVPLITEPVASSTGQDVPTGRHIISLPVLSGAHVTSGQVSFPNLDKGQNQPNTTLYTMPDGTYYLGYEDTFDMEAARITYTVETNDHAERRIRATEETTIIDANPLLQFPDRYFQRPITSAISPDDALDIAISLPGAAIPDITNPMDVAAAVRLTHTYSLTPYADSGDKNLKDRHAFTGENAGDNILKEIGIVAASIDSAICNTASLQSLLMSRGQDADGKPVQLTSGFFSNGDNQLTSQEGHMWQTDSYGQTIEPTPAGLGEDIDMTYDQKRDLALDISKTTAASLLAGSLLFVAGRQTHQVHRKSKLLSIAAVLEPKDPEEEARLSRSVALYGWLRYAADREYTTSEVSRVLQPKSHPTLSSGSSTSAKINALPAASRRDVDNLVKSREQTGTQLPPEVVGDVKTLVRNLRYQRKHLTNH